MDYVDYNLYGCKQPMRVGFLFFIHQRARSVKPKQADREFKVESEIEVRNFRILNVGMRPLDEVLGLNARLLNFS